MTAKSTQMGRQTQKQTTVQKGNIRSTKTKSKNRHTYIKKTQSNQKLLMIKNYLEQRMETLGYGNRKDRIRYDITKSVTKFVTKEGVIGIVTDGTLQAWNEPIKKFNGALPLELDTVDISSIKIQKAVCCKRCKSWKKPAADITRCPCGGYMVPRKRFSADEVESWDPMVLEVAFARKDIREAERIEMARSNRPKRQYHQAGITTALAGMSTIDDAPEPVAPSILLIPVGNGDELREIPEGANRKECSLVFMAAVSQNGKRLGDDEKSDLLKKYSLEPIDVEDDPVFRRESKMYASFAATGKAQQLVESWDDNHVHMEDAVQ
jgi:hypothetical protein